MITAKQLYKMTIHATDGHIGSVYDIYFDDGSWTIRYLVVDTHRWLPGRKVLLVPEVILSQQHGESAIPVKLTKDQVKSSPDIDTQQPISRQAEQLLHSHYGWIPYWETPVVPAPPPPPPQAAFSVEDREEAIKLAEATTDPHLRSARDIAGYHVHASDGEAGHIGDLLLDDDFRRILFFAVDVGEFLAGKEVLIPPRLVSEIDWVNSRIQVELTSRAIQTSQEYRPAA
jgi:sporulation protein YlmC with PRC-barrel domain